MHLKACEVGKLGMSSPLSEEIAKLEIGSASAGKPRKSNSPGRYYFEKKNIFIYDLK